MKYVSSKIQPSARLSMTNRIFYLLIIAVLIGQEGHGQSIASSDEEIDNLIAELFNGYRAGNSARVKAVFTLDATSQTIFTSKEGEDKLSEIKPISNFIDYIGKGLTEVHDERLWDTQIYSDDKLATVWTKYAFYLGDKFIHCGTETFLLRKQAGLWKIYYLVDTRQKTGCVLPPEIENK